MPVFYRSRSALITHKVFQVGGPQHQSFPINELARVHIVQTKQTPSALTPARAIWLALSAVALAAAAKAGVPTGAVLVLILVGSAVSAGCWRPTHYYEMRALYRGRPVCLFRTADKTVLGQVSRALLRAMEHDAHR